jgi:hypothetical protein
MGMKLVSKTVLNFEKKSLGSREVYYTQIISVYIWVLKGDEMGFENRT